MTRKERIQHLSKTYDNLEAEIHLELENLVKNSKVESKHVYGNCLPVNVFDYTELIIVHGNLTFCDSRGLQYSLYADCQIEDLIDILIKNC
jgi:hypothetical protein